MPTDKNIKTPDELFAHFEKYKKACKANPKKESIWSNKQDKQVSLDREIPLTWDGFEIWLRKNKIISRLDDYKFNKDDRYTEYAYILHAIGREIYEDKLTGAVACVLNGNIIARDLGLKEQSEISGNVSINPKEFIGDNSEQ